VPLGISVWNSAGHSNLLASSPRRTTERVFVLLSCDMGLAIGGLAALVTETMTADDWKVKVVRMRITGLQRPDGEHCKVDKSPTASISPGACEMRRRGRRCWAVQRARPPQQEHHQLWQRRAAHGRNSSRWGAREFVIEQYIRGAKTQICAQEPEAKMLRITSFPLSRPTDPI